MYGFFPDEDEDFPRWKQIVLHVLVGLWACCLAVVLFSIFIEIDGTPLGQRLESISYAGMGIFFVCIPLWWFISHMEIVREEDDS